jgi:hypothetical protein
MAGMYRRNRFGRPGAAAADRNRLVARAVPPGLKVGQAEPPGENPQRPRTDAEQLSRPIKRHLGRGKVDAERNLLFAGIPAPAMLAHLSPLPSGATERPTGGRFTAVGTGTARGGDFPPNGAAIAARARFRWRSSSRFWRLLIPFGIRHPRHEIVANETNHSVIHNLSPWASESNRERSRQKDRESSRVSTVIKVYRL